MARVQSASSLLCLSLLFSSTLCSLQCYYPDQSSSGDVPCDPNASSSACCGPNSFCLSNGLCYVNGVVSRGSCSDQTWQDEACPQYCTNLDRSSGITILSCDVRAQTFICAGQDCTSEGEVFTMRDANQFVFNNSNNQIVPVSPNSILNSTKATNDTGTTGSCNTTSVVATSATSQKGLYTAGDMAGVGVGVGVPLILALLGSLFFNWRQRKQMNSQASRPTQERYDGQHVNNYGPTSAFSQTATPPVQPLLPYNIMGANGPQGYREMDPPMQLSELGQDRGKQELDTTK